MNKKIGMVAIFVALMISITAFAGCIDTYVEKTYNGKIFEIEETIGDSGWIVKFYDGMKQSIHDVNVRYLEVYKNITITFYKEDGKWFIESYEYIVEDPEQPEPEWKKRPRTIYKAYCITYLEPYQAEFTPSFLYPGNDNHKLVFKYKIECVDSCCLDST